MVRCRTECVIALLFADTVLRAAAALGWSFDDSLVLRKQQGLPVQQAKSHRANDGENAEPYHGRLLVEGEQVAFRIEERFREEPVQPTAAQLTREKREHGYHAPRKTSVPTGALRLVRLDTYRAWGEPDRRSWFDRKGSWIRYTPTPVT